MCYTGKRHVLLEKASFRGLDALMAMPKTVSVEASVRYMYDIAKYWRLITGGAMQINLDTLMHVWP